MNRRMDKWIKKEEGGIQVEESDGKGAHQIETRRSLRRFMCVVGKRGRRQGITQGCVHPSHIPLEKCCFPKGIYASISGSYG